MRRLVLVALLSGCFISTSALAIERPEAQTTTGYIMPEFAQANPIWGAVSFHEHRTLGTKGCAVFSSLIVARQTGYQGDPITFTRDLQLLESFDDRGRLYWDRITYFAPVIPERMNDRRDAAYTATRLDLLHGDYVAIQLRTPWTREHWVTAISTVGDDLLIIDPAGGWRGPFRERYEPAHITGRTVFHRMLVPMQLAARW